MLALQHYIDDKNRFRKLFGQAEIEQPLSNESIEALRISLECDLSPENLSCDGELPRSEVRRRLSYLHQVEAELDAQNCREAGQCSGTTAAMQ